MNRQIIVATAQFDVSSDIADNCRVIKNYMREAAARDAEVILFPECALTGYHSFPSPNETAKYWKHIEREMGGIQAEAEKLKIWVLLGTAYRANDNEKPRNSLFVIDRTGCFAGRYDKRCFWGRDSDYYCPGTESFVVDIKGITCGFLICYDSCFPELYEHYRSQGVEMLFHAFFNAGNKGGETDMDTMIHCQQVTRATDNGFWIIASNSSSPHSRLGAGFYGPDGSVKALPKNSAGIITTTLPPDTIGWTYSRR